MLWFAPSGKLFGTPSDNGKLLDIIMYVECGCVLMWLEKWWFKECYLFAIPTASIRIDIITVEMLSLFCMWLLFCTHLAFSVRTHIICM